MLRYHEQEVVTKLFWLNAYLSTSLQLIYGL